jgi:hypothetical protein
MAEIKFRLRKDWKIKSDLFEDGVKTIFEKGHIFEPDEEGNYLITSPIGSRKLSVGEMKKSDKFEMVESFDMNVSKVDSSMDEEVNNWRIQLDVKTTKSKLKEAQKLIEKYVYPIF